VHCIGGTRGKVLTSIHSIDHSTYANLGFEDPDTKTWICDANDAYAQCVGVLPAVIDVIDMIGIFRSLLHGGCGRAPNPAHRMGSAVSSGTGRTADTFRSPQGFIDLRCDLVFHRIKLKPCSRESKSSNRSLLSIFIRI